jgi:hypothetical protein
MLLSLLVVISVIANGYLIVQLQRKEATALVNDIRIEELLRENNEQQQLIERTSKLAMTQNEVIAWVNREVASETIEDIHFTYQLNYKHEHQGIIESNWTMIGTGSPKARQLVGDGIHAFYLRVNALLEPKGLVKAQSYANGSPRWDAKTNTVMWEQPLAFQSIRKR